ncbi:MAG: carboxylesterase family protein [Polyangiaceae bacterium]
MSCTQSVVRRAIVASAAALGMSGLLACGDLTFVRVDEGRVQGVVADGVVAFKGIPYAAPPVGALRWRPPQSPIWKGVLTAAEFGADCWQLPSDDAVRGPSEDCLFANVWRPAIHTEKPLPVMVWLHGGELVRGSASRYSGQFLAEREIVVVTFNYRLGRLGFFAHPTLASEVPEEPHVNFGYLDQLALLQWVQRNIGAFGGDPSNVTIAGESAGGGAVLVHLTSPLSRGLFHRAIAESPVLPSARAGAMPLSDIAAAEASAVDYAEGLGIGTSEGAGSDDRAIAAELRALSAEKLTEGTNVGAVLDWAFGGRAIPGFVGAVIDGNLIVDTPEAALRSGNSSVPVLTGANDADLAASPAVTKEELFASFRKLSPRALTLYDPDGSASLADLRPSVMADWGVVEPSRHLAELVTEWGFPAYFYRFSYVPEFERQEVRGALQGAEVPYVFDAVAPTMRGKETPADVAMGKTMSSCWAAFVESGNPNGGGCPEWLPYDTKSRTVMRFANKEASYGPDPLKERLDLWRFYWR